MGKHNRCACSRTFHFQPGLKKLWGLHGFFSPLGLKPSPCNRHFHFKRISFRTRAEIRHVIREASPVNKQVAISLFCTGHVIRWIWKCWNLLFQLCPLIGFQAPFWMKFFFFNLKTSKNSVRKLKRNMRVSKIKAADTGNISVVPATGTKDPLFRQPMRLWLAH